VANQAHLKMLSQGVHAWNKWRKAHSEILPDLRNASPKQKNFSGANFRRVNFEVANLESAVLSTADLSYTNLSRANLSGASLKKTHLGGATLKETILDGTKFQQAYLQSTTFINVNLSVAKGLDQVNHLGPSTLDFGTIYLSKGDIEEAFLYGVGIPDIFIDYIRSQGNDPFDYYSCFISYASEDQPFVEQLYSDLEAEGVRCWWAPIDLKPGDRFPQLIEDAIHHHDKLIVVLSRYSIQSGWVEHEVKLALEKQRGGNIILFPIRLDTAYLYSRADWVIYLRSHYHIENFEYRQSSYYYGMALKRLLEALKKG
jgi:TIR domain-containing protein/pentapeptide repeat protein